MRSDQTAVDGNGPDASSPAEDAAQDLSLDELLERARTTRGIAKLDWRDPIVARGLPALDAIKPWLAIPELGYFAAIVIREVGQRGHRELAVQALREGFATAPNHVRTLIRQAIEQLGGTVDDLTLRPAPGASMIGWYIKPQGSWHEIVDQVDRDGRRQFLSACRRWNSEGWVTRDDRQIVQQPPRSDTHCERGQYTGSPSWTATHATLGDRGPYLFLQADVIWHIARGGDAVLTDEARSVYLTVCGRWIEHNQVTKVLPGSSVDRVCDDCEHFAEGDEPPTL